LDVILTVGSIGDIRYRHTENGNTCKSVRLSYHDDTIGFIRPVRSTVYVYEWIGDYGYKQEIP